MPVADPERDPAADPEREARIKVPCRLLSELFLELLAIDRFWMVGETMLPSLVKPGLDVLEESADIA